MRSRVEWAIPLLREAEPLLDRERDARLLLCLRHNLLDSLAKVGRYTEAESMATAVRALCQETGGDLGLVRPGGSGWRSSPGACRPRRRGSGPPAISGRIGYRCCATGGGNPFGAPRPHPNQI